MFVCKLIQRLELVYEPPVIGGLVGWIQTLAAFSPGLLRRAFLQEVHSSALLGKRLRMHGGGNGEQPVHTNHTQDLRFLNTTTNVAKGGGLSEGRTQDGGCAERNQPWILLNLKR